MKRALIDNLRTLVAHFNESRVARFVKRVGLAEISGEVRIGDQHLVTSVRGNEAEVKPVIITFRGNGLEPEPIEDVTISVAIPVKDAGDKFWLLLSSLRRQKGFKKIEIVVVDSGSSDLSVEIAKEYGAKLLQISPDEFSHSYARNLAADNSSGDYILFTVQDALPSSDFWLYELFSVLKNNDVVAVSCAESLKEDADLFYRASCWNHYKFLEVDRQDRILSKPATENYFTLRKNAPLSNLACLMPRELFLEYKFRGNFAEDLELGLRLIKNGYKLAMLSSTKVIHSHNRPAYYHLKRGYVDVLLLCDIFPDVPIRTMEPHRLLRDVLCVREVIDSLVQRLTRIAVASSVEHISKIVTNHYQSFLKTKQLAVTAGQKSRYVDDGFRLFLDYVHRYYGSPASDDRDYDGILLEAVQGASNTILEYMDDSYETVDETVLEEFRMGLYKMFAFQCGCHLAACYARGSEQNKQELEILNKELTQGV